MRCDNCPLCPIGEDDECAIADSDYGMEHEDGMSGCRHSWTWCRKKADEYAEHLAKCAEKWEMMMEEGEKQERESREDKIRADERKKGCE